MSNYGGKQPNNSAYIKTFFSKETPNNWKITNKFRNDKGLTPINDKLDVYIKKDLIISGSIQHTDFIRTSNQVAPLSPDDIEPIMKLRPCTYNIKNEMDEDVKHFGIITKDLETVLPQLVQTIEKNDIRDLKSINYIELIPILLAKIQDLQNQVDSLK